MILLCIFHNYNWSLYNLVQIGYKSIMKTIIVSFFVNLRAFKCRPSMFSGINFDKEFSDTASLPPGLKESRHSICQYLHYQSMSTMQNKLKELLSSTIRVEKVYINIRYIPLR